MITLSKLELKCFISAAVKYIETLISCLMSLTGFKFIYIIVVESATLSRPVLSEEV